MSQDSFKFYKADSVYGNLFFQFPKILMYGDQYKALSPMAKLAYMVLKDRLEYSLRNNWVDEDGNIYFVYTNTELKELFNCSEKTVIKTKKELEDKKKEIKQLEQENLNFSKTSHSIAHKQKALEYKLNELALKNEIAEEIDVKNRLNNITKQISKEPEIEISKTNITEIDDMLNYMKSECIKNKIKFEVQLNGNIYQMINNHITKEELEILIADHVKNAIIAVKCSNNSNRSILVRIGKIDGQYSIYIYDSGIEFEINTLHKLGKIPSTTHKESGGTGMGFMNTFDTLKKHKASITINEYGKPVKDNYTKVIMIVFNKKDEFNIISYRQKEIEVRKDEVNV